ncbi:MAG: D-glycero-beta-D-manno-heptose 1-phosphate adenylyltransferase [bacterium]
MGELKQRDDLAGIVKMLKSGGKKIVFTNGCFDILHAGHVRYLKEAKTYGDILVVGLNSDASVNSLKQGRPIVPQSERAEVLAALVMVDFVVIFDEPTPWELINALRPDVLVKGGDWKREDIVGSDLVKEVYSLPYHKGLSTTGIVHKIRSLRDE